MNWDMLFGSFSLVANFFIVATTLYVFYITYISKRISVISINHNHGRCGSNNVILLKNHTLRQIFISEAYLIYDNKYAVHLHKWDKEPLCLKSHGVSRIETKHYSYLENNNEAQLIGMRSHILLRTPEGQIIHAPFKKPYKIKTKSKVRKIPVFREYYDQEIIMPGCRYILKYRKKGEELKRIHIFPSGVMSEELIRYDKATNTYDWFNGLPTEFLQDIQTLTDFFKEIFEPFELEFLQLIERNADENEQKRSDHDDGEEYTYDRLISTSFSFSSSGFHTEVTS